VTTDLRPEQLPITAGHPRIEVSRLRVDVLADPLPPGDIVFANLLIHHFDRVDAVALLARMHAAATLGGAVFDLDRNRWAFLLARGILPLFARSAVTVADGLASVQQAFRRDELAGLAREAGIPTPRLKRYLGVRALLWWRRNETLSTSSPSRSPSATSIP
jgi:hypothetical protein